MTSVVKAIISAFLERRCRQHVGCIWL